MIIVSPKGVTTMTRESDENARILQILIAAGRITPGMIAQARTLAMTERRGRGRPRKVEIPEAPDRRQRRRK
jgi:hypothetical protein